MSGSEVSQTTVSFSFNPLKLLVYEKSAAIVSTDNYLFLLF